MGFEIKMNAGEFNNSIQAISRLVDEIKLNISEEGISTKAADPANVAMVIFKINKEGFEHYQVNEEMTVGLDLNRLEDILKIANKADMIELKSEDGSKLSISVSGFDYSISLLDPSTIQQEPEVPDLDLPAKIVLEGNKIRKAVRASEKISDYVVLAAQGNEFQISAEGDNDSVMMQLEEDELIEIETEKDARSLFSIDYLSDMSKSIKDAPSATVRLGTDYPVTINFEIVDGDGEVEYLLAPRIESS